MAGASSLSPASTSCRTMARLMKSAGSRRGLPVCEDIWLSPVCTHLKQQGAELLISPHGSPYEIDKDDLRTGQIAAKRVAETGLPLVFLNRVGGQDEVVFDGASFVLNGDGT